LSHAGPKCGQATLEQLGGALCLGDERRRRNQELTRELGGRKTAGRVKSGPLPECPAVLYFNPGLPPEKHPTHFAAQYE